MLIINTMHSLTYRSNIDYNIFRHDKNIPTWTLWAWNLLIISNTFIVGMKPHTHAQLFQFPPSQEANHFTDFIEWIFLFPLSVMDVLLQKLLD